jgi:hypothetical protein
MYLSRAENYDKELAESWKADADSILIFVRPGFRFISCALQLKVGQTGLFSAIVAAFVIEGLNNLQPDTGTSSVDLLSQISQQLAAAFTNESQPSVVLAFPDRSPFHVFLVDKRTVAPQPHREPLVRSFGHSSPTMGSSLPPYHPKSW